MSSIFASDSSRSSPVGSEFLLDVNSITNTPLLDEVATSTSTSNFATRFFEDNSPFGVVPDECNIIYVRPSCKAIGASITAEICVREAFQTRNLKFERIEEKPNEFVCVTSCFSDIESLVKSFSKPIKEYITRFYFSPERRAICCEMSRDPIGHAKIEYPEGDEWMTLLRSSRKAELARVNELLLANGQMLRESDFIKNPLFASTLEKEAVFQRLCNLRRDAQFQVKYTGFLEKVKGSDLNWADCYRENPIEFAYLSLYAHLNGEIDQDDLFVAHMVASAFTESPESASYTVLTEENAKSHLKENNYIPNSQLWKYNYIYCIEFRFGNAFLNGIEKKGILKRTTISYCASEGGIEEVVYESNHTIDKPSFGQVLLSSGQYRTTLLPPELLKKVYAVILTSDEHPAPPVEHKEYFGYRRSVKDLFLGRPISRASPLFFMPKVHDTPGHQLGIVAHDELFHCALDWINPYTQALIDCGKEVYYNENLGIEFKSIAIAILDRAVTAESICSFFEEAVLEKIKGFSELKQRIFFQICIKYFPPLLLQQISEIEMKEECLFLKWLENDPGLNYQSRA